MEKEINRLLAQNLKKMCETGVLFQSKLQGYQVWDTYMMGFGKDPKFRDPDSSVHNCNCCKSFFRHYGNIVALNENLEIITLFDGEFPEEYKESFSLLSEMLKGAEIENVFIETFDRLNMFPYDKGIKKSNPTFRLGFDHNVKIYTQEEANKFGVVEAGKAYTFNHFHVVIPKEFIDTTGNSRESIQGVHRTTKELFERAMREIPLDTYELVKDLINQGSLLDANKELPKVLAMIDMAREFQQVEPKKQDKWFWIKSKGFKYARFKNELIGVLCSDLAQGVELNKACKDWNYRVDPANYMKATAPITKKQIEEAKKFVVDGGYEESFIRRAATLDDIKVSDILHSNVGDGTIKPVSIFDGVKPTATRHKKSEFDGIPEVDIEKFMKDILPGCSSIEAYFTSGHKGNLVTMTTAENKDSKRIFRWPNNFSWTYNGNLAGKSQIKQAVKAAGGFVDAFFRFSIMWNEEWQTKKVLTDLDAHCEEPGGDHIYYSSDFRKDRGNRKTKCGGQLDIDMINPPQTGVENIYYTDQNKLRDGAYKFYVHHFGGTPTTFKAEIVFADQVYTYNYTQPSRGYMDIATFHVKNGEVVSIDQSPWLVSSEGSQETIWGIDTLQFHKVNLVCLSPNYWDPEHTSGNKHYFFMLEGCKCPNQIRSFHIENLQPSLAQHRKVFEVLGNTNMIEPGEQQLSGLGFDETVKDSIILRLKGSHNRVIKVNF